MITVNEASNKIYQGLYNICFNMPQYDYYSNSGKYLINQRIIEQSLDSLQNLLDNCEETNDSAFNKLVHKVLGTLGSMLFSIIKAEQDT